MRRGMKFNALLPGMARARRPRATRRGTVLLLVLGALAMVLILTVVYAALGKGDRQTARSLQRQQDSNDIVRFFGAYVAGVVGADVFDVAPDLTEERLLGAGNEADMRFLRESTDTPLTDATMRSVPSLDDDLDGEDAAVLELFRFRPTGGHATGTLWPDDPAFASVDPRIPSDPWLADTRPFDLGPGSKSDTFLPDGTYFENPYYERAIDWKQISNLAPDGRFVNLGFLRPDFGGSFDTPSLDLTRDPASGDPRLGLFDADGEMQIGDQAELGFVGLEDAMGSELPFDSGSETPDWNIPAHWTMYQRAMHRHVAELDRLDSANTPGLSSYWPYQYADADGNGFIDSRWFELTDAGLGTEVTLLPSDGRRYFAAVRVIDLSSLVNVNTASDLVAPPTQDDRIGAGPFETSLFSLLTMTWHPRLISGVEAGTPTQASYGSGGSGSVVGAFDFPDADEFSGDDYADVSSLDLDDPVTGILGRKAYKRIRQSIVNWEALPYEVVPDVTVDNGIEDPGAFGGVFREGNMALYTLAPSANFRSGSYIAFGSTPPAGTVGGNDRIGPFGLEDLIELLTHHGGNDPDVFTPLEAAFVSENRADEDELGSRSLLRSDRSLAAEVGDRIDLQPGTDGAAGVGERESNRLARAQVDVRSLLTTVSGARPLRSRLVGPEGVGGLDARDRKIRLDDRVIGPATSYTALEGLQNDAAAQQAFAGQLLDNAFLVYLETLAPYLDASAWDPTILAEDGVSEPQRTQYYGHAGPEMAVRLAAHLALNFRDMADAPTIDGDGDTVPDTDILQLDLDNPTDLALYESRVDEPTRGLLWMTSDETRRDFARGLLPVGGVGLVEELENDGLTLDADRFAADPDEPLLDDNASSPAERDDALILHGLEAQPFLSEVVFMTAYVDTPRGGDDLDPDGPLGGDGDVDSEYRFGPGTSGIDEHSYDGMVNIDGTPSPDNPDFFFQIVGFQLFNPFDVPVRLDDMYIEFGNRFYRFSDVGGNKSLVLQPFETAVAYATNPGLDLTDLSTLHTDQLQLQFDGLISATGTVVPPAYTSAASIEDIFDALLGPDRDVAGAVPTAPIRRLPLQRYDSGLTEIPTDATGPLADLLDGDRLPEAARSTLRANQTAMLWWDIGDKLDPATGTWDLVNRRDDVMLDRLTDRESVLNSAAPILDQRLLLEPQAIDPSFENGNPTSTLLIGAFTVENALKGYAKDFQEGIEPGGITNGNNYNENRHLSAMYWGKLRRHDDPGGGLAATALLNTANLAANEPRFPEPDAAAANFDPAEGLVPLLGMPAGALPANILEPVAPIGGWDPEVLRSSTETSNGADFAPYDSLHVVDSFDLFGTVFRPSTALNFSEFVNRLSGLSTQTSTLPNRFLSTKFPVTSGIYRGDSSLIGTQFLVAPDNAAGNSYADEYITFANIATEFRSTTTGVSQLRVGDMLLPLAVGPYRRPLRTVAGAVVDESSYPTDPNERIAMYELQWVTLGEVLAEVAGYSETVTPVSALPISNDTFNGLRAFNAAGDEIRRVLDRGRLRLDAWVPYYDADPGAPNTFEPGVDRVRGYGVPLATTIFEIAQAGGELPELAYGGLTRPVTGLVNINTAPPSVMRTLPGLFPDTWDDSPNPTDTADDAQSRFWDTRIEALAEANGNELPHMNAFEPPAPVSGAAQRNQQTDVASSILAYRDPSRGHVLMQRFQSLGTPGNALGQAYEMDPEGLVPNDPAAPTSFDAAGGLAVGRQGTGIAQLRKTPGIGSLGELLAVRLETPPDRNPHQSMTWLGRDGKTLGMSIVGASPNAGSVINGVPLDRPDDTQNVNVITTRRISTLDADLFGDPFLYHPRAGDQNYPAGGGPAIVPGPDQIADDYDEQLVQINMLLNSASVSSDYYAAWMVIHGYAPEDVEGLSATDPLVPSFRGRYLLILDRSSVVEPGDAPRVLAFLPLPSEVPAQAQLGDF